MRLEERRGGLVSWTLLLSGPLVWFVHFVAVYGAVSLDMVGRPAAGPVPRVATGVLTLVALAVMLLVWVRARRDSPGREGDDLRRFWTLGTRALVLVSAIAVVFQALPAVMVP